MCVRSVELPPVETCKNRTKRNASIVESRACTHASKCFIHSQMHFMPTAVLLYFSSKPGESNDLHSNDYPQKDPSSFILRCVSTSCPLQIFSPRIQTFKGGCDKTLFKRTLYSFPTLISNSAMNILKLFYRFKEATVKNGISHRVTAKGLTAASCI